MPAPQPDTNNLEVHNKVDVIPYFSAALGEKEAAIVMLRAEREMLMRQLQVMKLELDALKQQKKEKAEKA
jgi:hypothetical protein